ncbi:MAG: hypothetical protein QUS14_03505 [Pyrinomonadaceae bacterium]|nr:hypothetical protein [Pyrinomonadaceae bacterium]
MNPFEGKSPAERNKIIAAIVLGVAALVSLYLAFGQSFFGSRTTVTVTATPTPRPTATSGRELREVRMPTQQEQYFDWQTTPVVYNAGVFTAPDPGRNIFAFYEPPIPCRGAGCPSPIPPTPPPPTPAPTPPVFIAYVTPTQVFAGSRSFRLEVSGDKFTPDMKIYFSQSELPTSFINAQRMVADIPATMISGEGPRQIIVQSADGKLYSNQVMLNVQPPPKPQVQFVGVIARQHANNDTAEFRDQGRPQEITARLNDVIGGRFRLVSISTQRVIFEDVNLGFRHPVDLFVPAPGSAPTGPQPAFRQQQPFNQGIPQPGFEQPNPNTTQGIPGIPDNIPRYVPPNSNTNRPQRPQSDQKDDEDGEDKPRR